MDDQRLQRLHRLLRLPGVLALFFDHPAQGHRARHAHAGVFIAFVTLVVQLCGDKGLDEGLAVVEVFPVDQLAVVEMVPLGLADLAVENLDHRRSQPVLEQAIQQFQRQRGTGGGIEVQADVLRLGAELVVEPLVAPQARQVRAQALLITTGLFRVFAHQVYQGENAQLVRPLFPEGQQQGVGVLRHEHLLEGYPEWCRR